MTEIAVRPPVPNPAPLGFEWHAVVDDSWRLVEGKPCRFMLAMHPDVLELPLRWRKPRRVFVNSMSDLFHDGVSDEFIAQVFAVMAATPEHAYQVLTKRHGRMRSLLSNVDHTFSDAVEEAMAEWTHATLDTWPLPNVWLGVSVEDQKWADIRLPALYETPAAVRWVSAEPLLGPVRIPFIEAVDGCTCAGFAPYGHEPHCGLEPGAAWGAIHWVVVGGESGPNARPMHPDWARALRDQCNAAGVPFFFKQWGEWIPESLGAAVITEHSAKTARYTDLQGGDRPARYGSRNGAATCHRVGKKTAGRELDGRSWDQYPAVANG